MFCRDGWKLFVSFFVVSLVVFSWSGIIPDMFKDFKEFDSGITGFATSDSGSISVVSDDSVSVSLKEGWNLVSVPFKDAKIEVNDCDVDFGSGIWHFNSEINDYDDVLEDLSGFEYGKGYWVYSNNDCSLKVSGSQFVVLSDLGDKRDGSLKGGSVYTHVGSPREKVLFSDYIGKCSLTDFYILGYDPGSEKWVVQDAKTFSFESGNAYWILNSNEDSCKLEKSCVPDYSDNSLCTLSACVSNGKGGGTQTKTCQDKNKCGGGDQMMGQSCAYVVPNLKKLEVSELKIDLENVRVLLGWDSISINEHTLVRRNSEYFVIVSGQILMKDAKDIKYKDPAFAVIKSKDEGKTWEIIRVVRDYEIFDYWPRKTTEFKIDIPLEYKASPQKFNYLEAESTGTYKFDVEVLNVTIYFLSPKNIALTENSYNIFYSNSSNESIGASNLPNSVILIKDIVVNRTKDYFDYYTNNYVKVVKKIEGTYKDASGKVWTLSKDEEGYYFINSFKKYGQQYDVKIRVIQAGLQIDKAQFSNFETQKPENHFYRVQHPSFPNYSVDNKIEYCNKYDREYRPYDILPYPSGCYPSPRNRTNNVLTYALQKRSPIVAKIDNSLGIKRPRVHIAESVIWSPELKFTVTPENLYLQEILFSDKSGALYSEYYTFKPAYKRGLVRLDSGTSYKFLDIPEDDNNYQNIFYGKDSNVYLIADVSGWSDKYATFKVWLLESDSFKVQGTFDTKFLYDSKKAYSNSTVGKSFLVDDNGNLHATFDVSNGDVFYSLISFKEPSKSVQGVKLNFSRKGTNTNSHVYTDESNKAFIAIKQGNWTGGKTSLLIAVQSNLISGQKRELVPGDKNNFNITKIKEYSKSDIYYDLKFGENTFSPYDKIISPEDIYLSYSSYEDRTWHLNLVHID